MRHHRPRLVDRRLLGTRQAAGVLVERHPDQIRRRCQPVACDATSRALLYDLDDVQVLFDTLPRRQP